MLNNDYDSISNQGGFLNVLCCWWMAPVIAYWYCPDPVILECECLLLIDVHSFPGFFILTFYSVLIVGEKSAEENVLSQQSSLSEEVGARKFSGPH